MTKAAKKNITASLPKTPVGTPAQLIGDIPGVRFILPWGILQEAAEIIDDQENHIVITLRIPKEVIRNYQPLLRALIEMAAADDDAPAKASQ